MRKRRSQQIGATLFLLNLALGSAFGASSGVDFSQVYSFKAAALGLGGAYRAYSEGSSGMLLNPAGMAIRKGEVSFSGDFIKSGMGDGKTYSAAAVDYKASDVLAMGVEYDHSNFSTGVGAVAVNQITLGAATDLGHVIFVGANVKGFFSTVDSPFISGPDGFDMDLGITVRPIPLISVA